MKLESSQIRLAELEARMKQNVAEFGKDLAEIRDSKLYRAEFKTFEEYCQERWGFGRNYGNRLIQGYEVIKQLQDSTARDANLVPIGTKITTEGQARVLASVPEEQRAEVVAEASKNGKVTAKTLTEAAEKVANADVIERDHEGHEIPTPAMKTWERRHELDDHLYHISKIRSWASDLQKSGDRFYAVDSFSAQEVYTDCGNIYRMLKELVPWSVCGACQGQAPKTCKICNGRGMISKHAWEHKIDPVTKKMMKKKADDSPKTLSAASR